MFVEETYQAHIAKIMTWIGNRHPVHIYDMYMVLNPAIYEVKFPDCKVTSVTNLAMCVFSSRFTWGTLHFNLVGH